MDFTPYTFKVRATSQNTYFVQLCKGSKVLYTTKEYREATHAHAEAVEWLDPSAYSPPVPDRLDIGTRIYRWIVGLPADPSYIKKQKEYTK